MKKSVIYMGNYERVTKADTVTHLVYIVGGEGLFGIYVKQFKGTTPLKNAMYYVYPDHLGSFSIITDANGTVKQKCTFDTWGRRAFSKTLFAEKIELNKKIERINNTAYPFRSS